MFSNLAVVSHHDEVVEFRALANHRRADHAAIDGRVGSDLDIVLNTDRAKLRNLFETSVAKAVSVPVGSDHDTRMQDDPLAKFDVRVKNDSRVQR